MGLGPTLNFEVNQTYDSRVMAIVDTSVWKHLINEPTYIDITLPGKKTAVTHTFQKSKVNLFNSSNLGYGCVDCEDNLLALPDGIYTLKLYVCEGSTFSETRYYLRTVNLELRLNHLLTTINLECQPNSSCLNQLMRIWFLIKGAKADILFGNVKTAGRKYNLACDLMDDLENCDCTPDCSNGYDSTGY